MAPGQWISWATSDKSIDARWRQTPLDIPIEQRSKDRQPAAEPDEYRCGVARIAEFTSPVVEGGHLQIVRITVSGETAAAVFIRFDVGNQLLLSGHDDGLAKGHGSRDPGEDAFGGAHTVSSLPNCPPTVSPKANPPSRTAF